MKNYILLFVVIIPIIFCSCRSLEIAAESAGDKSIAVGNDTWGFKFIVEFVSQYLVPNFTFCFGRTTTWYISVKRAADAKEMEALIKASQSTIAIEAGKDGVGVSAGDGE